MKREKQERAVVDWEGLASFLKSKGAKNECPLCESTSWSIPTPTSGNIVGLTIPWGNGEGEMYMQGLPVLPLFCNQCYFVKQLALVGDLKEFVVTISPKAEPSGSQEADQK